MSLFRTHSLGGHDNPGMRLFRTQSKGGHGSLRMRILPFAHMSHLIVLLQGPNGSNPPENQKIKQQQKEKRKLTSCLSEVSSSVKFDNCTDWDVM